MRSRTLAFFGYNGANLLDLSGPMEVFSTANAIAERELYRLVLTSPDGESIRTVAGPQLSADMAVAELDAPVDTLVVPGSHRWAEVSADEDLLASLRIAAGRSERIASVCAGAFMLAAIGLLDGRRATTHWQLADELAARHPGVEVDPRPIFVRDDPILTSAGITSGIDLSLAMLESDQGPELTREVARFLVVFMQRPGNQAQFSARMLADPANGSPLRDTLDLIAADPAGDHRLAALSDRAGFSERHFTRLFKRELGVTPARYVESVRFETARSMLETSDAPLDLIAKRSGLATAESLRRCFARELGITPHAYRQRFRTTGVASGDEDVQIRGSRVLAARTLVKNAS
jgi:transcriptional regulator GlxA family with amidase domain